MSEAKDSSSWMYEMNTLHFPVKVASLDKEAKESEELFLAVVIRNAW
jgi:hypothetical protein